MIPEHLIEREARKSLKRILPRLEKTLGETISKDPQGWEQFTARLHGSIVRWICANWMKRAKKIRSGFNRIKCWAVFATLTCLPMISKACLGFIRINAGKRAIIFANFSEEPQTVSSRIIEQYTIQRKKRLHGHSNVLQTIEPLDLVIFG